jgi:hypothetical protein
LVTFVGERVWQATHDRDATKYNVKIRINYISEVALILQTFFENNSVAIIYFIF